MRVCRKFTLMNKDKINVEYLCERKKFNIGCIYLLMTSVKGYVHKRQYLLFPHDKNNPEIIIFLNNEFRF